MRDHYTTQTDTAQDIVFGLFTHASDRRPVGKHFWPCPLGTLQSETVGTLSRSTYQTVTVSSLADLVPWMQSQAQASQHLTQGVSAHDKAVVVPRDEVDPHEAVTVINRTNEDLPFRPGGALMCVDSDSRGGAITMAEVWNALTEVQPQLTGHAFLQTTSSSSCVMLGQQNTGVKGLHGFFHVADATDIPRALEALHVRLCISGHARHRVGETGKLLARSFVDLALQKSSQPIYIRAHVTPPVTQDKLVHLRPGIEVLDTRACIPDLTDEERQRYTAHLAKAEVAMADEMRAAHEAYVTRRTAELVAKRGITEEQAKASITSAMGSQILTNEFMVRVRDGWISVADILAQKGRWHEANCHDPLEPEYGGLSTAKIYSDQGQPTIASYAHSGGGKPVIYKLAPMPAVSDVSQLPAALPVPESGLSVRTTLDIATAFQDAQSLLLDDRQVYFINDPQPMMQGLLTNSFTIDGQCILTHWQNDFYLWLGTHWEAQEDSWLDNIINHYLSKFVCTEKTKGSGDNMEVVRLSIAPTAANVTNLKAALRAIVARPRSKPMGWPDGRKGTWQALQNGILNMDNGMLCPHDPDFFNTTLVNVAWQPDSILHGTHAERFFWDMLATVDQVTLLQEVLGYILSGDTSIEKAFMMIGKKRSGKGTFNRLLKFMLPNQIASARSSELADKFVMERTIGKSLMVIPDVRLSSSSEFTVMTELMLTVTGQDDIDVRRMHKPAWQGKTTVRMLLMSNSLPMFRDGDGVLASRFIYLHLPNSFFGREDHGLGSKLEMEAAAVFKWAVDGWQRLKMQGRFSDTTTNTRMMQESEIRMDPIGTFFDQKVEFTGQWEDFIPTAELLAKFNTFAVDNDVGPFSEKGLANLITSKQLPITKSKDDMQALRGYRGLKVL